MPLVTTSRKAGPELIHLSKELTKALDAEHQRRGKKSVPKLVEDARKKGLEEIFMLTENEIRTIKLDETNWNWKNKLEFKKIRKPSQKLKKTTENQMIDKKVIKLNKKQLKVKKVEKI